MKLKLSRDEIWRNARSIIVFKPILVSFSYLYLIVIKTREIGYKIRFLKTHNPSIKTICIGNISTGGSGKTPLCAYILNNLSPTIKKALITRGYGNRIKKFPYLVSKNDISSLVGDEVALYNFMLKNEDTIVISPKRIDAYPILKSKNVSFCLMDDGYQHFSLKAHFYICLIDLDDYIFYKNKGTSSLLPTGIFRELPVDGINRANRIVFVIKRKKEDYDEQMIKDLCRLYKINSYSIIQIKPSFLIDGYLGNQVKLDTGKKISILTAIAKPESFKHNLESLGYIVSNSHLYNDHHYFSKTEWLNTLNHSNDPIICTTKDWVKLKQYLDAPQQLLVLIQDVSDLSNKNNKLMDWITHSLN